MIGLLAVGSILTVGGLRLDFPTDSAPVLYGLDVEGRFQALTDVTVGVAVGWSGGVNDTNPNRKLIAHRAEVLGTAGYRLGDDALAVRLAVRFGVMNVWGWPRGALSRLDTWGPAGGLEVAGELGVGSLWLEPYAGFEHVRLNQIGVDVPYFGVRLGGTVGQLFDE